jgi:hypothetical protein
MVVPSQSLPAPAQDNATTCGWPLPGTTRNVLLLPSGSRAPKTEIVSHRHMVSAFSKALPDLKSRTPAQRQLARRTGLDVLWSRAGRSQARGRTANPLMRRQLLSRRQAARVLIDWIESGHRPPRPGSTLLSTASGGSHSLSRPRSLNGCEKRPSGLSSRPRGRTAVCLCQQLVSRRGGLVGNAARSS